MNKNKAPFKNKTFEILSLFSGAGLLDIGFINQGFQVSEAIEIEPYFIKAYNYGLKNYFKKSNNYFIKSGFIKHFEIINPVDASNEENQDLLSKKYFNITGIIGGPPCQDFSIGGNNAGINGKRGKLIYSYFNIVNKTNPDFIFFENVAGLLNTKAHNESFTLFVSKLENCGYQIWYDILNPLDYGFPQDRPRIALVGFKNKIINKLKKSGFIFEKNNKTLKESNNHNFIFRWPKIKFKNPKLLNWPKKWEFNINKDIKKISDIEDEYKSMFVYEAFKNLNSNIPNQNEFFNPKSDKFEIIYEGDTNRKSFKRLHRFRYSPTVAYGNNEVHLHPTLPRRLSVREGLRLQTVPDEYVLPSDIPLTYKFKLISNGVPTAKAELIAKEIRKTLINYYSLV